MSAQKLVVVVMLVSLMLQSGLQVNRATLSAVFKNYPLLARSLLVNFILVPLVGVILVRLFRLDEYIAIGIVLMAIAPGVPFLPRAAGRKAGGSLSFALELSFLMPAISIVTVPLTARLVFPPDAVNRIPIGSTIETLVILQLVPLVIGVAFAQRAPDIAEKLVKPLAIVIAVALVVLLVLIAPLLGKAIATVYGSYGLLTALAVVLLSAGMGWLFAGREDESYRVTLAIATMLRNIGLASLIATVNFPRTPVVAMVFSYFLIQLIVMTILSKLFVRRMKTPEAPAAATV